VEVIREGCRRCRLELRVPDEVDFDIGRSERVVVDKVVRLGADLVNVRSISRF